MARKDYGWAEGAILGDHSKKKHEILKRYFAKYLKVRCQIPHQSRFVLTVIDGFCGSGVYEDDHVGSPIIFVDTLEKFAEEVNIYRKSMNLKEVFIECYCIFNDKEPAAIESLRSTIQPYIAKCKESKYLKISVDFRTSDFSAEYLQIIQKLDDIGVTKNVFFNLDQCGHSLIVPSMVSEILTRYRSAEAILTFSIESLLNYLPAQNAQFRNRILSKYEVDVTRLGELDQIIGKHEKRGLSERLVFEAFERCAPFVSPFAINNPGGWRYWLMHFSNTYKARQVYTDLLYEEPGVQGHVGRSGLRMLQYDPSNGDSEYLFRDEDRKIALDQLSIDIPREVSGFGTAVSVDEFTRSICNQTPAHSRDILSAIIQSPEVKIINENGNPRRSVDGVKRTDLIEIELQRSFHYMPRLSGQND